MRLLLLLSCTVALLCVGPAALQTEELSIACACSLHQLAPALATAPRTGPGSAASPGQEVHTPEEQVGLLGGPPTNAMPEARANYAALSEPMLPAEASTTSYDSGNLGSPGAHNGHHHDSGKGTSTSCPTTNGVASEGKAHDQQASCALLVPTEPEDDVLPSFQFNWKMLLKFMGPGLLMSIAYIDPGNLESCLQTGAKTGYVLLWVTLSAITMGFLVQMQAAKLGVATGLHLAEHCGREYPTVPRYLLWIMAEIAIIGSDIQEVIGSALALVILSGGAIPIWAGVLITSGDCFLLLLVDRMGFRFLEAIFAVCIGIMSGAFGYMYATADVPQIEVAKGFVIPRMPAAAIPTAVAMVGALIMPHNIYLHSALVQSRNQAGSSRAVKRDAIIYIGIESAISLLLAVFINLFVIAVFAKGFFGTPDADDVGLFSAGDFIAEKYGHSVKYIWAVGLLAAGQSSTMTGTYTGQFVMTGYLNLRISPWKRVMITRSVAIVPTLLVALSFGDNNAALDKLCQGLNLLQSVQLPFALIPVLTMCGSQRIMGAFVNSTTVSAVQWLISLFIIVINMFAILQSAEPILKGQPGWIVAFSLGAIAYFAFLAYLVINPWRWEQLWPYLRQLVTGKCTGGRRDLDAALKQHLARLSRLSDSATLSEDAASDLPPPMYMALAAAAVADELKLDAIERIKRTSSLESEQFRLRRSRSNEAAAHHAATHSAPPVATTLSLTRSGTAPLPL